MGKRNWLRPSGQSIGEGHRKWKYEMGSSGVLPKWMKEGLQDPGKQLHLFLGRQTDSFAGDNVINR